MLVLLFLRAEWTWASHFVTWSYVEWALGKGSEGQDAIAPTFLSCVNWDNYFLLIGSNFLFYVSFQLENSVIEFISKILI